MDELDEIQVRISDLESDVKRLRLQIEDLDRVLADVLERVARIELAHSMGWPIRKGKG